MRKIAMLLLAVFVCALMSFSVLAASVSTSMPSRISPGDNLAISFSVSGVTAGELFTLEEKVPVGWAVSSWDVTGAKGGKDKVNYRYVSSDNRHGFSYPSEGSSSQITLNVKVPATAMGNYNFDAVYFDSSGQGRSQAAITVRTITCGDGVCEGSENTGNCVKDCPAPAPPPEQPAPSTPSAPLPPAKKPTSNTTLIIVVVAAIAALMAWWFLRKKKSK